MGCNCSCPSPVVSYGQNCFGQATDCLIYGTYPTCTPADSILTNPYDTITSITVNLDSSGSQLGKLQVNSLPVVMDQTKAAETNCYPSVGCITSPNCPAGASQTMTLGATQRVKGVSVWAYSTDTDYNQAACSCCQSDRSEFQISQIAFDVDSVLNYQVFNFGSTSTSFTKSYTIQNFFAGFKGCGRNSCEWGTAYADISQIFVVDHCLVPTTPSLANFVSSSYSMTIGLSITALTLNLEADSATQATSPSCPLKTIQYQITDIQPTPPTSLFSYPSAPTITRPSIVMNPTQDYTLTRTTQAYTFKMTVSYQDSSQTLTSSATGTAQYTNPCQSTTIPSQSISTINLKVADSTLPATYALAPTLTVFTSSNSFSAEQCGASEWILKSLSPSPASGFITFDQISGVFTLNPQAIADVGTYTVTVTQKLTDYCPTPSCVQQDSSFTVVVVCLVQLLQVVQQSDSGPLVPQSATLDTSFNYALKTIQTPACGFSVTSYTMAESTNIVNLSQSTTAGYSLPASNIPISATSYVLSNNPHQIGITSVGLSDGSTISITQNFQLTIHHPCEFTSINTQTIGPITFSVFDATPNLGTTYNSFTEFTDTVGVLYPLVTTLCGPRSYILAIGQNAQSQSLTTFSLSGNSFFAFSNNMNQIGTYAGTLTISLQSPYSATLTVTFQVIVSDPCLISSVVVSTLNDMSTSVLAAEISQQVLASDTISNQYGSGATLCGGFTYSVASFTIVPQTAQLLPTELSVNSNGLVTLSSSLNSQIGTILIEVTSKLTAYFPTVPALKSTFILTVNPCIVTSFTFLTPAISNSYTIFTPFVSFSYTNSITVQNPLCGYDVDFAYNSLYPVPNSAFINSQTFGINQIQLTVQTDDIANQGTFSLQYSASLNSYTYPMLKITSLIDIQILDPCFGTILVPQFVSIEDLIAFEGFQAKSISQYKLQDTISNQFGVPNICGFYKFTFSFLNQNLDNQLLIDTQGEITFAPALKSPLVDKKVLATLTVSFLTYPLLHSEYNFYVTTLSCQIEPIENISQIAGSGSFLLHYKEFVITPTYAPPNLITTYNSYFVSDQDVEEDLPSFIKFNPAEHDYTVQPTTPGTFNFRLKSTFDLFPTAQCFTDFEIQVNTAAVYLPKPVSEPMMDIIQRDFIVIQCEADSSVPWNITLPLAYSTDLNATITSEKVSISSPSLTYNALTRIASQTSFVAVEKTDTVKIELQDSNGFSSVLTLRVTFGCPETNPIIFGALVYNQYLSQIQKAERGISAQIDRIFFNGTVQIGFNTTMSVSDKAYTIQNETLVINNTVYPLFDVTVLPGKYSDTRKLNFTWKFINLSPQQLTIDLLFDQPDYVSIQDVKEKLKITIYGFYLFQDIKGNFLSPEYQLPPKTLPMIIDSALYIKATTLGSTTTSVTTGVFASSLVVSLLVSSLLQQILSAMKQLQIQTHMMLFRISVPVNAQIFYSLIMQVVALDLLNFDKLLADRFGMDDSEPFNDSFQLLGYSSLFSLRNFGSLILFFFVPPLLCAIVTTAAKACINTKSLEQMRQTLMKKVFFNGILDFFNETYMLICMCCLLNTFQFKFDTFGHSLNSLTCIVFGIIVCLLPPITAFLYLKNFQLIHRRNKVFMERYGGLVQDLNFFRNGQSVIWYRVITMARKLALAGTCVYLQSYPQFCIFSVHFQTLSMIIFLGYTEPFKLKVTNKLELMNEVFTMLVNYHLICFTDFVLDPKMRNFMGSSLTYIGIINIFLNIGQITLFAAHHFIRKLKLQYLRLKQKRELNAKSKFTQAKLKRKSLSQLFVFNHTIDVTQDQTKNTYFINQSWLQPTNLSQIQSIYPTPLCLLPAAQARNQPKLLNNQQQQSFTDTFAEPIVLKSCLKAANKCKYPAILEDILEPQFSIKQQAPLQVINSRDDVIQLEQPTQMINKARRLDETSYPITQKIHQIQELKKQGFWFDPNEQAVVDFTEIEPRLFNQQKIFEPDQYDYEFEQESLARFESLYGEKSTNTLFQQEEDFQQLAQYQVLPDQMLQRVNQGSLMDYQLQLSEESETYEYWPSQHVGNQVQQQKTRARVDREYELIQQSLRNTQMGRM